MSIESIIVMSARKARANGLEIDFQMPRYLQGTTFEYNDGSIAEDIHQWFSHCLERNISDIKISLPLTVEQHPFEGTNETYDIICIWGDGQMSRFVRNEHRDDVKYTYIYNEANITESGKDLVYSVDNTTEYKNVLSELMIFAKKIGYEIFNSHFEAAYKLLEGSYNMNTEGIPYYLIGMPMRLVNIIGATKQSYVFGGMGCWNDDPRGQAEYSGLKDEYNKLTNALIYNMRKALVYVTNSCWEKEG